MTIRKIPLLASAAAAGALALALGSGTAFAAGMSSSEAPEASGSAMSQEPALFSALDANNDGKISQSELQRVKDLQNNFAQADSNQDGTIDQSEFSAFEAQSATGSSMAQMSKSSALFQALDTNNDGTLSQAELKPAEDLLANFNTADTNHDGSIDQSEFSAFEAKEPGATEESPKMSPEEAMPQN